MARTSSPGARSAIVIAAIAFVLTGCATNRAMMPTPVLYTGENARPLFTELSIDSRRPSLDLLYITDRAPAEQADDLPYTAERSRSMAFGSAMIEFGEDVSWDALVKESTATQRVNPLELKLGPTTELGRFPAIPYEVVVAPDGIRRVPAVVEAYEKAKQQLQAEIARRLAIARRKEVVLFVHGYNTSFESAALTMGELCHFLGRDFVCGIFTWPAGGHRGILFGYDVDRESAEYAVEDLVKTIRIVGRTPGVERIHLIAHSRGTDTVASALARAQRRSLHAPQLARSRVSHRECCSRRSGSRRRRRDHQDLQSVLRPRLAVRRKGGARRARSAFARAQGHPLRFARRQGDRDGELALRQHRTTRADRRDDVHAEQITAIDMLRAVDIIQVRGTTDFFGHSYFVSNPR